MRRLVVGAGIAVLVLALVGAPAASADEVAQARESWKLGSTLLEKPIATRRNVAIAVRGSRAVFVGGVATSPAGRERTSRDAAVLDLRSKKWRDLPEVPFRRTLTTGAIWAGKRLVVVGVVCRGYVGGEHGCGDENVAAVYSAGEWKRLRLPRAIGRQRNALLRPLVASGRDVVFARPGTRAVAVNLRTERWRVLPPDLGWTNEPVCSARRYAAFLGGAPPGAPNALHLVTPGAKRWDGPKAYDDGGQGVGQPACAGASVVATTFGRQAACAAPCTQPAPAPAFARVQRFDLATERWSDVAPPSFSTGLGYYATGHDRFVDYLGPSAGAAVRLEPATGAWSQVAPGPAFEMFPVGIFWTRGLAVVQDFRRVYVYRPI